MLKSILELKGVSVLDKKTLKVIDGGIQAGNGGVGTNGCQCGGQLTEDPCYPC
ncbi:hypothetical protein [Aquimarina algicola]|uniref:hypothetical protein n=1 Tax=Aquimarina algicola TaxID=2589995 RepID=UPI001CF1E58D|nr:hypothetical protein [Aquimarina algicola]